MLILPNTSSLLRVVTGQAADIDVHASWADYDGTDVEPNGANTAITTATTTTIVASPGSGVKRNVRSVFIRNKDASDSCDVTVVLNDGSITAELFKATLRPGGQMSYTDVTGFFVSPAFLALPFSRTLEADQSNSTVTPTEISGLTVELPVGKYGFIYHISYQAAATSTGVRFSINFDGTQTAFAANRMGVDNNAAGSTSNADQDSVLSTGVVPYMFAARSPSVSGWGTTVTVDTANSDMMEIIQGYIVVSAVGNLELWHGSEVAAQSTVRAGSKLLVF